MSMFTVFPLMINIFGVRGGGWGWGVGMDDESRMTVLQNLVLKLCFCAYVHNSE